MLEEPLLARDDRLGHLDDRGEALLDIAQRPAGFLQVIGQRLVVGAAVALYTSIRAVVLNPLTMALWGFIVAALLLIGSLPFFLGLTVVMPVLGHATWRLYRKLVEPDAGPRPDPRPRQSGKRYAADFPANLFPWAR